MELHTGRSFRINSQGWTKWCPSRCNVAWRAMRYQRKKVYSRSTPQSEKTMASSFGVQSILPSVPATGNRRTAGTQPTGGRTPQYSQYALEAVTAFEKHNMQSNIVHGPSVTILSGRQPLEPRFAQRTASCQIGETSTKSTSARQSAGSSARYPLLHDPESVTKPLYLARLH